jgi:hypothetical protein
MAKLRCSNDEIQMPNGKWRNGEMAKWLNGKWQWQMAKWPNAQ